MASDFGFCELGKFAQNSNYGQLGGKWSDMLDGFPDFAGNTRSRNYKFNLLNYTNFRVPKVVRRWQPESAWETFPSLWRQLRSSTVEVNLTGLYLPPVGGGVLTDINRRRKPGGSRYCACDMECGGKLLMTCLVEFALYLRAVVTPPRH